ncbi:biosynthetic-type acetolactate synthase large subunit [Spiribacter vilamensis]|uniref:Acetolactate synthase n=1 Tax=Spiribacter vilamensis TaxID=531306 RepID=A0A4Q8CYF6_9GAMM|nr:biosynthetic-type acetolactate synthase large subunit [Spiribacter vilamensis]RZU98011.1 acetolactate synthase large subunit [Spiribacter vilamensis]TVO61083.1 biosynthetic-type acetolactate synthase large subunit [Spiribacter vilamensis]
MNEPAPHLDPEQTDQTPRHKSGHPRAGEAMSGAEMVVEVMAQEGVDTVFGYSGGAILPTYDAVFRYNERERTETDRDPMQLVVPANEQGAGFMAAGYARSTGKVGCFLVTSGPGATNTVTPIRDCMADSVPVVGITGQVARAAMGTDAFQEAPIVNIMGNCAKHVFLVTRPEQLEETIRTAFEVARSGRPGPVVVDLPKDVQNWVGEFKGDGLLGIRGYRQRMESLRQTPLAEAKARQFFEMLGQSRRPLLYVGGGAIHGEGSAALTALAHEYGIPSVSTLMGLGAVDTTDDLHLHMLGMHGTAYANYAVEDCDFIIAVGSRFDDRVAAKAELFAPNAENIAHIDIDAAEIGKVKKVTWSHVGEAGSTLHQLLEHGRSMGFSADYDAWGEHCRTLRERHPMDFKRDGELIQPQAVMRALNDLTGGNAIITTGVGQHQMWAAQYLDYCRPRLWLTSGSMGTMGFGLPAAIGAQFANPGELVIDIDGDGSLRMNLGEMETVTTYGLPVKILLLNNVGDGMVRQWQKLYFGDRFSGSDKSLHRKNFIKAAEADGFEFARSVSDPAEMATTLEAFIQFDGPAFLEVGVDPDTSVYPMVGPGMGYKQMVTGEYIPGREIPEIGRHGRVNPSEAF